MRSKIHCTPQYTGYQQDTGHFPSQGDPQSAETIFFLLEFKHVEDTKIKDLYRFSFLPRLDIQDSNYIQHIYVNIFEIKKNRVLRK